MKSRTSSNSRLGCFAIAVMLRWKNPSLTYVLIDKFTEMTNAVLNAMSAKKQSDIKAWEEETLQPCSHVESLLQVENVTLSGKCNAL
jgi:hypothetical protein